MPAVAVWVEHTCASVPGVAGTDWPKYEIVEAGLGLRIALEETLESFSRNDSWFKFTCLCSQSHSNRQTESQRQTVR